MLPISTGASAPWERLTGQREKELKDSLSMRSDEVRNIEAAKRAAEAALAAARLESEGVGPGRYCLCSTYHRRHLLATSSDILLDDSPEKFLNT